MGSGFGVSVSGNGVETSSDGAGGVGERPAMWRERDTQVVGRGGTVREWADNVGENAGHVGGTSVNGVGRSGHGVGSEGYVVGRSGHRVGSEGYVVGRSGHRVGSDGYVVGRSGHRVGSGGYVVGRRGHCVGSEGYACGHAGTGRSEDEQCGGKERQVGTPAGRNAMQVCIDAVAHPPPRMPGFMMWSGSKARRTRSARLSDAWRRMMLLQSAAGMRSPTIVHTAASCDSSVRKRSIECS